MRCRFRLLSQFAHFFGYHGKTSSLLTGPRRFNRGIERKQIGLTGNRRNQADNLTDLRRTDFQFFSRLLRLFGAVTDRSHLIHGDIDRFFAFNRRFGGLVGKRRHFTGGGGHFFHGGRDFFDNRRGFVNRADLLFAAHRNLLDGLRHIVGRFRRLLGTGGQLFAGCGQLLGRLRHLTDQPSRIANHFVKRAGHIAKFIAARQKFLVHVLVKIAGRHFIHPFNHRFEWFGDKAGQEYADHDANCQ